MSKEPTSPCSSIVFLVQPRNYHHRKDIGTILELVASITRVFDIMNEEMLETAVDESDGLAHICELYRCKNGESRIPEI